MKPAVVEYSTKLAKMIQAKFAEYAELSQTLDRSFPSRLVSQASPSEVLDAKTVREKLEALEAKRQRLIAAGLLDETSGVEKVGNDQIQKRRDVLSIYVNDTEQKLGIFDGLVERIELFQEIVQKRFLYKRVLINKKSGFSFASETGEALNLDLLSSGEQHELVLLCEMLFAAKPGTLILIDEPEISLHVVWQQEFLSDLAEITKLVDIDVLIATHSPSIVNDRWDLTVELKGPAHVAVP